ncbi:hypothetical protein SAY87_013348 [Trapa incisa]|uniref:Ninja-family protein n=1 Tax=Trapa incisa TaxID=236973 RepID=A0AAN7QFZ4_9MYRT|nr:hypothetical protein SAY87_013348 [Trapa incisa]
MCRLGTENSQMGEAGEGRINSSSSISRNLSLQFDKYPRDLLQRFMPSTQQSDYINPDEKTHELELNLGLSLGGQFGVDKSPKNSLIRSSSIAEFVSSAATPGDDSLGPSEGSYPPLTRTTSLPAESEEAWRKRKELQMMRRMVAKKRRSEKQRNLNSRAERESGSRGAEESEGSSRAYYNAAVPPLFGLSSWTQVVLGGGDSADSKGKGGVLGGSTSRGSAEPQGGCSIGMSEPDSRPKQGSGSGSCSSSPVKYQLLQDPTSNDDPSASSGTKNRETSPETLRPEMENPSKKPEPMENRGKEMGIKAVEDMPCVFTKGCGPNGRRIEGILYKYGKGEEVRIMCVCHGSFLSPAEFVKHAGGDNVTHPLRHIVINRNSSFTR